MLRKNIFGLERRTTLGLFFNENNMRPTMMLFYIFFIAIFLPQLTLADIKPLTLNTGNDLKVMEGTTYQDGTLALRFAKSEANCNLQPLYYNVIQPDGTTTFLNVGKHSILAGNFCPMSTINLAKRDLTSTLSGNVLVKRHTECEGNLSSTYNCCSKYPDLCSEPKTAGAICSQNPKLEGCSDICKNSGACTNTCDTNPYGPGCNVNCGAANPPPGCANIPDCGNNSGATGCNNGKLDCNAYPTAPGCTTAPDCSKTPTAPGCTPVPAAPNCSKTPTAPGCVPVPAAPNCSKTPTAPGCVPVPAPALDCSKNPNAIGCECTNNPYGLSCVGAPNCGKTPTAAGCQSIPVCNTTTQTTQTTGCYGGKLDCSVYPRAPECLPNCASSPYLPGCNDCTFNPNAIGCNVCSQNPQATRCLVGYCDKFPDVPECSLIMMDKIKSHAIKEGFILVTYLCNPSANDDTCGSVIDWKGFERSHFAFESTCSDGRVVENVYEKGFVYVCYKSATKEIFWATYGTPDLKGTVTMISSNTITNVETFNSDLVTVFATEDGGYAVTTSSIINNNVTMSTVFISKDFSVGPRIQIYQDTQVTKLETFFCSIAYQSSGYTCIVQTTKGTQVTYTEIDFLRYGNATTRAVNLNSISINNTVITGIQPLNYGGYVVITTDRTNGNVVGYVYDNSGTNHGVWDLPQGFYTDEFILPNNTIVAIPKDSSSVGTNNNNGTVTVETSNVFTTFSSIEGGNGQAPGGPGGYGSSRIASTNPTKGAVITLGSADRQEFTITYTVPVAASTGNVSIFQVEGNNATLKQTVAATNNQFVSFEGVTIVKFRVLTTFISTFNVPYFVAVDNDFAKEQSNGQNVIGIRESIWNFTTTPGEGFVAAPGGQRDEDESAIIRLTTDGTNRYFSLPSEERKLFANTMSDELASAISCERSRLSTTEDYQYDANTSQDQIIMRVDIEKPSSPQQTSSEDLVNKLNETVAYGNIDSIFSGLSTSYLDTSNGAPRTEKLWNKYWGFLLAALILFAILIGLFIIARIKSKEGGERNFLPIFASALIPIDLALDIAFISLHHRDFKWVGPTSIVFLVFPIVLNLILTTNIIKREKARHHTDFNNWWRKYRTTANVFKVASYLDTDALQVVSSRVADIESLSAPFTKDGIKSILFSTGLVVFFEDIPQFVFYSVYLRYHIKPAIVPILVLSSCIMVLLLKFTSLLCSSCCYGEPRRNPKRHHDDSDTESTTSSEDNEKEDPTGFAPGTNQTNNIPTRTREEGVPQGGGGEGGPQDRIPAGPQDRPQTGNKPEDKPEETFGNIPASKDNSKPVDFTPISPVSAKEEKLTKSTPPTDRQDNKDAKKPGITAGIAAKIPKFRRKSKDTPPTVTSDVEKETVEVKEETETKEITEITTEDTKPRIDSTIRNSTVEEFDNGQKYLELERDGKDYEDLKGTSNATVLGIGGGGFHSYPGYSGLPVLKNPSKKDKLDTSIGAAIAGVTVAGGASIRYIYIYLDIDEEKDEKEVKPVNTIKTTTTKSSSTDVGEKYITKTDTGKEYITTKSTEGKYITKSTTGEKYTTEATNDVEYITKTISNEEYITIIETVTTTTTTTSTSTSTTSVDDREYVTKSKSASGKDEYILITSSSESSETLRSISSKISKIQQEITTSTVIDEYGNETITETITETDENGKITVTVKTTKKDANGKILDTYTETNPSTTGKSSVVAIGKTPARKETKTFTDEYGIITETVTEIETDEDGNTVTKVTTTKKDSTGKILETNTETTTGITQVVTEPEEMTSDETTTRTVTYGGDVSGSSKSPARKQTRTFNETETDENGIMTVTTTTEVTDEDGTTTTTVVTTKKDQSGKEIGSTTETRTSEPVEIVKSSSKTPTRKQTKTFNSSETDENGVVTEISTEIETDENGKTITKVTTTKKDLSGKVLETNTEVKESFDEPEVTSSSSTSKFTSSIIGPSIYQQGKSKLKEKK